MPTPTETVAEAMGTSGAIAPSPTKVATTTWWSVAGVVVLGVIDGGVWVGAAGIR